MARNRSAMKYHRQSEEARLVNRSKKSTIRTFSKKAATAAEAGDFEAAAKYHKVATSLIDKASSGSALHKKTAARKKSRLTKNINKLQAQSEAK